MSSRPGFIVDHRQRADGGVPPNQYRDMISIQIRVHFPPKATRQEVAEALSDAVLKAYREIETHSWKNW